MRRVVDLPAATSGFEKVFLNLDIALKLPAHESWFQLMRVTCFGTMFSRLHECDNPGYKLQWANGTQWHSCITTTYTNPKHYRCVPGVSGMTSTSVFFFCISMDRIIAINCAIYIYNILRKARSSK